MSLNFVTSETLELISILHAIVSLNKFLFLIKVCTFHFKQLLACLSKRLISIAIYDRVTQRIEGDNRKDNGMGQNYYIHNVATTFKNGVQE